MRRLVAAAAAVLSMLAAPVAHAYPGESVAEENFLLALRSYGIKWSDDRAVVGLGYDVCGWMANPDTNAQIVAQQIAAGNHTFSSEQALGLVNEASVNLCPAVFRISRR